MQEIIVDKRKKKKPKIKKPKPKSQPIILQVERNVIIEFP